MKKKNAYSDWESVMGCRVWYDLVTCLFYDYPTH